MDQVNGEYKTICDGLLDGYKGKVYGTDDIGTEHDDSCTMRKVIIENGKVVSATGELQMLEVIANLGEDNNNGTSGNLENTNQLSTDALGEVNTKTNDTTKLPKTGEENSTFANWLSIVIILGIFWLLSMLLIDREKKKINQTITKRK